MDDADHRTLQSLTRLVLKHDRALDLVETLAMFTLDHAQLIALQLARCSRPSCKRAATVEHRSLRLQCCDHCAARLIVNAIHNSVPSWAEHGTDTPAIADEAQWVDVPNASAIRRMHDVLTSAADDLPVAGALH